MLINHEMHPFCWMCSYLIFYHPSHFIVITLLVIMRFCVAVVALNLFAVTKMCRFIACVHLLSIYIFWFWSWVKRESFSIDISSGSGIELVGKFCWVWLVVKMDHGGKAVHLTAVNSLILWRKRCEELYVVWQ